jgi:single-stranded-DNA-specific exonuclease
MLIQRREFRKSSGLQGVVPPLLERIYSARNVCDPAELDLSSAALLPPETMHGMGAAVDLLQSMLNAQGRVLIVSDFDADGATSCALVLRALRLIGFHHLDYIVPDRFVYGYGLSPEIARLALDRAPDLVITVDNGISSHEGVDVLRAAGIKVLITDHHLPGSQLPAADAILNPNQPACEFASKALAGVGVAFYLMLGLRARLRQENWFVSKQIPEPNLAQLLDLVALGTVADLVPLDRNNRILVHEGLRRIRAGRACAGIQALLEQSGRNLSSIVAADLGFIVGPRLNAAGRLEDMSLGIACLLTDEQSSATLLAEQLDRINSERKRIENEMREQAMESLQSVLALPDKQATAAALELPAALCLYDSAWHQGVAGLLASRVKEKYNRPTVVFADAGVGADGEPELKGSARSIPGLHIRDLLDLLAARYPGMINRFGGHAMAAGLSLPARQLPEFRAAFTREAALILGQEALSLKKFSDGPLQSSEFSIQTALMLRQAGPWGQNFPEPVFDGEFSLISQRLVAGKHLKMVVAPYDSEILLDAIYFNADLDIWPDASRTRVRLVFRLDINEFRGQSQLQLLVEHMAIAATW